MRTRKLGAQGDHSMTIQHYNWCAECETEWRRDKGDTCPNCGGDGPPVRVGAPGPGA